MKAESLRGGPLLLGGLLLLFLAATPAIAEPHWGHDGRHDVLDERYHHGRFYPTAGVMVHELPVGYRPYFFHGSPYYFHGGVWYAPIAGGFVVTHPPLGLVVSVLPPFYTTVWFGGVPYYYANDVYYRWDPAVNGYEIVNAPPGAQEAAPTNSAEDVYIYPQNGQSKEQQAADRFECHTWAKNQTGFDATQVNGGVPITEASTKRADYNRAMCAWLEARGYSVK
jgi:hypothetical protein